MIDPNFLLYAIEQKKKKRIEFVTERELPMLLAEINQMTRLLNEMIDGANN
jgi:hypothetical protein